jgi:hypothetical protein
MITRLDSAKGVLAVPVSESWIGRLREGARWFLGCFSGRLPVMAREGLLCLGRSRRHQGPDAPGHLVNEPPKVRFVIDA